MLVNPITPLSVSNRKTGASAMSVIPQVRSQSIPAFTGTTKRMGILASIAMALGLSGCPENNIAPNVDTIPPQPTSTATATMTSVATSTATTETASSKIGKMFAAAKYNYDASKGAPKAMSWTDKASKSLINATRSDDGSDPNYLKYDVQATDPVTGHINNIPGVQEYFYSPDKGEMQVRTYDGTGTLNLTIDPNTGDIIYTDPATGAITDVNKRINSGIINDYTKDGVLQDVLQDVKFDGNLVNNTEKGAKAPTFKFSEGLKQRFAAAREQGERLVASLELPTKPAQFTERLARGIHV